MLSKFLRSAKSLLNHTTEPESSTQLTSVAIADDEVMVTTRKQAGSQDTNLEESPKNARTRLTRSTAKSGVEVFEETETLPVRVKDGGSTPTPTRSKVEVVIPVSHLPEVALDSKRDGPIIHEVVEIPDSEDSEGENEIPAVKSIKTSKVGRHGDIGSLNKVTAGENDKPIDDPTEVHSKSMKESKPTNNETGEIKKNLSAESPGLIKNTEIQEVVERYDPASGVATRGGKPAEAEPIVSTPTQERRAGRKIKSSITKTPMSSSPTTLKKSTTSKTPLLEEVTKTLLAPKSEVSKHKRFGSEEPVEVVSTEPIADAMEDLNSDDDSDDAPEEFNKESAAKVHEEQDRDATRAIEKQEAAIREKRKERDATLRKQAEIANTKRKRREEAVENQLSSPKKAKILGSDAEMDIDEDGVVPNPPKLKFSRASELPEFLPAEFLKDDDDSETNVTNSTIQPKLPHKTKHIILDEKKPKDRRKGSTIYRVSDTTDMRLAPKASSHARSEKARKMHGGNRKPFSKSFFKTKPKS